MTTRRRIMGTAILAVWVVMVGWQVRREYFQPELARLAEAALALDPGIHFYSLTMGDRVVGQATSRLDTVPDGFRLQDFMSLELPAMGQTGTAVARTEVGLSPALEMRDFTFSLDSEVGRFSAVRLGTIDRAWQWFLHRRLGTPAEVAGWQRDNGLSPRQLVDIVYETLTGLSRHAPDAIADR